MVALLKRQKTRGKRKIPIMLKTFVILVFAASVASIEACCNPQSDTHIYRVGRNNCPCTRKNEGALRYRNKVLEVCNGYNYVHVGAKLGSEGHPALSCRQILVAHPKARNGVYYIRHGNIVVRSYCVMDSICGARGWNLIMKLDGRKGTFRYGSQLWKNKAVFQPWAVNGGLNKHEMKSANYHLLSFSNLCVGMKVRNDAIRWLKIPQRARSLYSLIADDKYRRTTLGRNAWKTLLKDASLQRNCNREGFNAFHKGARARIGVISNQENDCNTPDSRIAFGGAGSFCGQNNKHSVGNEAKCHADNGDKSTAAFGYILAQ